MEERLNIFDKITTFILNIVDSSYSHDSVIASLHPYVSFFAVSIPVFLIFFYADNIKGIFASLFALYLAYLTGYDAFLKYLQTIPVEADNLLYTHKMLAMIVVIIYIFVLLTKIISLAIKKVTCDKLCPALLTLAGILIAILAYTGISMVFDYGMGVVTG